jgi:predicted dehydrogenase
MTLGLAPRTPDPMAAPALRWGILGTGWVAERFVASLRRRTRQQVVAVGSRDGDRAVAFAARHGIVRAHGTYGDLVTDREVDVVYVGTSHRSHLPCARLALEAGKPVLVEKPLALDAEQAREIAALAHERGLFCMEALWTLFLPRFDVVRQLLDDGAIGEVHTVLADCGERFGTDHRIMRPELDGGPLLDLGTYPIALARWVLGDPERVLATAQRHETGVDGQIAAIMVHPGGSQAVIHTTILSETPTSATIAGTEGAITLNGPFYQPGSVVQTSPAGERRTIFDEPAVAHDALHFQAAEAARCVAAGQLESPIRPLRESIATLAVLDEIGRQCSAVVSTASRRAGSGPPDPAPRSRA